MKQEIVLGVYGIDYFWKNSVKTKVLNEISFELLKGDFIALIGPNGSGKSTLLKVVAGILPRTPTTFSGIVQYLGYDFFSLPAHERAQRIVYVGSETPRAFPITAFEAVSLARICHKLNTGFKRIPNCVDSERIQWAMEQCCCWDLRMQGLDKLSDGQLQLVALARGVAQEGKVLFLDETLSRVDVSYLVRIGKMLNGLVKNGRTILLVSHDINLMSEWCSRGLLMKDGQTVADGKISEIISQEMFERIYPNSNLTFGTHPATGKPKIFI
jgi:iron complex transport system ATP-binding protein